MESSKMDYSKTVNLPKTDFQMKANLPQREPEFLKVWEDRKIYEKLAEKNKAKTKFILHDGPPYANGHIHLGTALNKILKDFIVKYRAMSGFNSPYTPGWDCHGLPIEQAAMKELKTDKHKVDMLTFRKQAAQFAKKFIDIQRSEFKRLGVFSDWENPYLTLDPKYESTIVKVFGELAKLGYIYRQKKPVYWCPSCETALADAEVEYADHQAHSIYVKFKVLTSAQGFEKYAGASVLIWTTTPWTLPANVALAFHPRARYVFVSAINKGGAQEYLIISKQLSAAVSEKLGLKDIKILEEIDGVKLEGLKAQNPLVDSQSVGILADFVTLEDGTGVVHIAPGHGQEDYAAGLKYKLPIISPVDDRGRFTPDVPEFAGQKVFAANALIIDKLKSIGSLLYDEVFSHSYPHCWRCKKPVIFRATPQWFMGVDLKGLRNRILCKIKEVKWVPAYGENRITSMIESRPDWCLSRQRLWGVPIPVFYCIACGEPVLEDKVINMIAKLVKDHGADIWYEKSAEELLSGLNIKCSKCSVSMFKKETDILDVWFDSGVSSEAVLKSGSFEALSWPADMYLEGSDQHRGWFQTSILPAVAINGEPPYKTVLTHGFVVDGEGKKMSKSVGNVILPEEIISKYGADILRLWVSASDYREDIRISPEILKGLIDTYRKIRNTLRFLLGNISGLDTKALAHYDSLREIDKHALSELQKLIVEVRKAFDSYEFHKASLAINNFCSSYLSGFYFDSLKDTLYCDDVSWDSRKSAQSALRQICVTLAKLVAPIISFTAEETWTELRKQFPELEESVFLADFPNPDEKLLFNEQLNAKWECLFKLRGMALEKLEILRRDKKIGSNLEARIDVSIDSDFIDLEKDFELLCSALGSWDVKAVKGPMSVSAERSPKEKCLRCWRFKDDVNVKNKHNENLCGRCVEALAINA